MLTWIKHKYFLSKGKTSKIGKAYELSRVVMEHPGDVLGSKCFDKLVQSCQWTPLWDVRLCWVLCDIKVLGKNPIVRLLRRNSREHLGEVLGSVVISFVMLRF